MPRSISPRMDDALDKDVEAPYILFEVVVKGVAYRYSSFFSNAATVLGLKFAPCNLVVTGPVQRAGGVLEASVSLPFDQEKNMLKQFVNMRPHDSPARLWHGYWDNAGNTGAVLIMDGVVNNVTFEKSAKYRITFDLVSKGNRGGITPFIRIAPPTFNFVTKTGTVFVFNGQRYEVRK